MFKIIVLISIMATSYCAVRFQPFEKKPAEFADQEGCYIPELNRVLDYDEAFRPADGKPCALYVCTRNNETQIDTCGNAVVPDGCRRISPPTEETTADNCCGVIECD